MDFMKNQCDLLPLSMLWTRARVLQISIPRNLLETRPSRYYVPHPAQKHETDVIEDCLKPIDALPSIL